MKYNFYYNNVPGIGQCRNNLIYTSLMSEDKKTFVQWYHNDTEYHAGQNQVVDPALMQEKFDREVKYLTMMCKEFPQHVPNIIDIDHTERKIYLHVDGDDFWEQAGCMVGNYHKILPDWQEQMLGIIKAHKDLGLYKYSMHPSSYFVIEGKLKSINYFFTYQADEGPISIAEHQSHISENRKENLRKYVEQLGIGWDSPQTLKTLQDLCFDTFKTNYPSEFMEQAKKIYND